MGGVDDGCSGQPYPRGYPVLEVCRVVVKVFCGY